MTRSLTRPGWVQRGDSAAALTRNYTFKARKTSFHLDRFDSGTLTYLPHLLRRRLLLRLPSPAKPVWLVGERQNRAQDTGFHFFRYLRERHPDAFGNQA